MVPTGDVQLQIKSPTQLQNVPTDLTKTPGNSPPVTSQDELYEQTKVLTLLGHFLTFNL